MKKKSYLYVIYSDGFVKIGRSGNLLKRLECLCNPHPVELLYAYEFDSSYGSHLCEIECHKKLYDLGMHWCGEWFHFQDSSLEKIVDCVVSEIWGKSEKVFGVMFDSKKIRMSSSLRKHSMRSVSNNGGVGIAK